ncbi:MAG: hypothetical protein JKY17_09540 [Magnetovibrio sp.]|nr:hypothetical protein [Magnetovibrio sp.]
MENTKKLESLIEFAKEASKQKADLSGDIQNKNKTIEKRSIRIVSYLKSSEKERLLSLI